MTTTTTAPRRFAPRVPIGRKLAASFGFLLAALLGVTAAAWFALDRIAADARRNATVYAPQFERISQVQLLMIRISLEARHAMLEDTPEGRTATAERIGAHRKEMLAILDEFERGITTEEGKRRMAAIRAADRDFWRLGGEVLAKVNAGDVPAAFAQLKAELVPARDRMITAIVTQRDWQQTLKMQVIANVERTARNTHLALTAVTLAATALAGWMAWSITRMMNGAFARAQAVTQRIAGGRLGDEIYVRKGDEFGQLFESIVEMQDRLVEVVANVRGTASRIVQTAQALESANAELREATQAQTATMAGTSDSAQRMAEAVRASADSAADVSRLATQASRVAGEGGQVVGQVVDQMQGIDQASKRIHDIVGVIDGIAFQTNILALNAAVEAARAGEQGRGFAVVAAEVRSLAQRSASAAKEVKALIEDSVRRVASGADAAGQAGETMQSVVGQVDELTRLMGHIAQSAAEQRLQSDTVGRAVGEMDAVARRNAQVVERSHAAAQALREHAEQLESAVGAFNLGRT